ncbi:MAG: SIR2 family protein [Terriglobia bacterium]
MQSRESRAVAFLFGAGASARFNYPMVANFFGQCEDRGFPHKDCEDLWRYIRILERRSRNEKYPEINAEAVFSLAEQIRQVDAALRLDSSPSTRPHRTQRPVLRSGLSAEDLYRRLTDGIITVYGRMPEEAAADSDPLAELVKEADEFVPEGQPLWLFTTNYDTVIENSLDRWIGSRQKPFEHMRLATGIADQRPHRLDTASFPLDAKPGERPVNLVKLHGSATWKHETSDRASPILETDMRVPTDRDCALFFGYKRIPDEEPFVSLHRLFKRALSTHGTLVSIGFQFGDPFLRELVDFALRANDKLKVLCCLRSEPADQSTVRNLEGSHRERFKLLRDKQGKLVRFDDKQFCTILREQLEVSVGSR